MAESNSMPADFTSRNDPPRRKLGWVYAFHSSVMV